MFISILHSIAVLPQQGIEIIGSKSEYKMGEDILNLTCVAKKSKPVQILTWFVNDIRVSNCIKSNTFCNNRFST